MKIAVLSDGGWGTALAINLIKNSHQVTMWGAFPDYLLEMEKNRENSRFLSGVKLPNELMFQADISKAIDEAEVLLFATPTQYLRAVLEKLKPYFDPKKQIIVNAAKGIENKSALRISEMVESILGEDIRFVALSGPSHAEEVSRAVPTAVVAASKQLENAVFIQNVFMNENFRVYTSDDVIGVELGGAIKNVMAIAAGIIDGMNLGDNPKAAMITRAIYEMSLLGEALGGKAQTFSGLSGIGDLIVTCCSGHSRNRYVGEELGKGRKLDDITKGMGMVVAEGVCTALGAKFLSDKYNTPTPLINEVYNILYCNKDPQVAVKELMSRSPRSE